MKKLLTAFTLAEVLITLGIIGVIARVTLPALMADTGKQQAAVAFMKALNTLETANLTALAENDSQSLANTFGEGIYTTPEKSGEKDSAGKDVMNYSNFTPEDYFYGLANYVKGTVKIINGKQNLITKDGISFARCNGDDNLKMRKIHGTIDSNFPAKYAGYCFGITIDINGPAKPNRSGEDQFIVLVDDSGAVLPCGSMEAYLYDQNKFSDAKSKAGTKNALTAPWENATRGCNEKVCSKSASASGAGTTYAAGSIAENGGKIIYKITK